MDWSAIWETVKNFLTTSGLKILYAIGALIIGLIIIKLILAVLKKTFSKSKMEKTTQSFMLSILKFALYILLILIVMSIMGIPITGVIAMLSAAGLAIGLALQDSLSNLANGIILITSKPFKEGDYVAVDGVEGKIHNIKMLTTSLITNDNKLIVLPNSKVVTSAVVNYNNRQTRRVDFTFSVAYESDVEKVKAIFLRVVDSDGRTKKEPAPFISLKTLNESSIDLFAYCWVDTEDYWGVYYYIMDKMFNELKRNDISIPYQQVEVRLRQDKVLMPLNKSPLPNRVEKVKAKSEKKFDILSMALNKKKKPKDKNTKEVKTREKSNKKK